MRLAGVSGFAFAVLQAATSLAAPKLTTIPIEGRCGLLSQIMNFKIEVHPGVFRLAPLADETIRRLAYWRGKPLVCAYGHTPDRKDELPVFSPTETCEDFTILHPEAKRATDSPEACVGVALSSAGADRIRFFVTITAIKFSPGYRAGYGRGTGYAPVEGIARRHGKQWELKQLFKPKPSPSPAAR